MTILCFTGVTTKKQVAACVDTESEVTLTCAASEYILIKEAQVYITLYKTTRFCKNPSLTTRSCHNYLDASIKNYFEECNTLSSCNKQMPVNPSSADNILTDCKTRLMHEGDVYINVEYECKPCKYSSVPLLYTSNYSISITAN